MKRRCHTKQKTAGDGDPVDSSDPSGEELVYDDDDRRPARYRRPNNGEEAEE